MDGRLVFQKGYDKGWADRAEDCQKHFEYGREEAYTQIAGKVKEFNEKVKELEILAADLHQMVEEFGQMEQGDDGK